MRTGLSVLLLSLALSGPAQAAALCDVAAPDPPASSAPGGGAVLSASGFAAWLAEFRERALAQGIPSELFNRAMEGVHFESFAPNKALNARERTQRIWDYLRPRLSSQNITLGREKLSAHAKILERVRKESGIPGEVLLALWGIETGYGANKGQEDIFQVMANLAYEGGRRPFFEANLIAAMQMMQRWKFPRSKMKGSYAGAVGHAQFMPESYLTLAIDADGDGTPDLFNSLEDAFASKANFLRERNASVSWVSGQPWLIEVQPPAGYTFESADQSIKTTVGALEDLGVTRMDGRALTSLRGIDRSTPAAIFAPGGKRGPALVSFPNFDRFLDYNPSLSYALAVALWANALSGAPGLQTPWPEDEPDLTRGQVYALQAKLNELGLTQEEPDGAIGKNTRAGIRAYQAQIGAVTDGFASCTLVRRLLTE